MNSQQSSAQRHWTEIDFESEMDDRLVALGDELSDIPMGIDAFSLFMLEALGYTVDLETGMVTKEEA